MADRDLHLPHDGAPTVAAVVLHPHPGMGGDRHHPLVVAVAEGLAARGIAALRLDLSDPDPRQAVASLEQVAGDVLAETETDQLLLVGYSWGAAVTAMARPDGLTRRVLVAPPVAMLALEDPDHQIDRDAGAAIPTLVLVPAHDQYGPPDAVRAALGDQTSTTIEVVEGADHFLVGAVARIADRCVAWATDR